VLDLNDPADARVYLATQVSMDDGQPVLEEGSTDEDAVRLAQRIFLYASTLRPVGPKGVPH